jgi:preprotein translocase subunit SecF
MEFFRIRRDIPFMRHSLVLNLVSFVTFLAAVFFLVTRGLHLSIEFTGGTVLEFEYAQPADVNRSRATIESLGFGETQVQTFGTSRDILVICPNLERFGPLLEPLLSVDLNGQALAVTVLDPAAKKRRLPAYVMNMAELEVELHRGHGLPPREGQEPPRDRRAAPASFSPHESSSPRARATRAPPPPPARCLRA